MIQYLTAAATILSSHFTTEIGLHKLFYLFSGISAAEEIVQLGDSRFCGHVVAADSPEFLEGITGGVSSQFGGALITLGAYGDDGAVFRGAAYAVYKRAVVAWYIAFTEGFQDHAPKLLGYDLFENLELYAGEKLQNSDRNLAELRQLESVRLLRLDKGLTVVFYVDAHIGQDRVVWRSKGHEFIG